MKSFNSMTDFINYYNQKQTIPSSVAITINGKEHEFTRTSHHNNNQITKRMTDNYRFIEEENCGLGIELHVNYYRYFEAKVIAETYFIFFHDEEILYLNPIYFYNKFVNDDDFHHCKDAVSNSLEKWTGLKWVNINRMPNAFEDIRSKAYSEVQKDLFYELPSLIKEFDDEELDPMVTYVINEKRKKKWHMDRKGDSPYFSEPLEVPDVW